ncbi:PQQ-binding-like beta-propeller repeat protein [Actinoplanes sp. N902-109]|uniref:outer membrane protein assembly factor BamB family protein n=1 Tax=Actinoplanes sp. (strain N902-109) TaxID=649831 RepID=UPI0003295991|nr:PQQ-binding-like beta-propeller repeat protein [Actinoplanes sp. N902-109]AGL20191.1 hypothetical protein L083_6681 [Actinoplanes sp. N902-109]
MALIELSTERPAQPVAAGPPPARYYRRAGLLVCALLVLALGGAAPQVSMLWQRTARLPTGNADFAIGDGRVFTVAFTAAAPPITAWSAGTGRRLWSVPGPPGDTEGRYTLYAGISGLLIVTVGDTTTVLDAATGALRWQTPAALQTLDTHTGLLVEERFRPGTGYDPNSGDPGLLYGTGLGNLHTEPPVSTALRGVDLATGRTRWTASTPGPAATTATAAGLVVIAAGRITLRSAATGAVLRERPAERSTQPAWGEAVGRVLLVHHGSPGEAGALVAYDTRTLDRLWARDQPDSQGNPVTCTGLICLLSRTDVLVLDPATGAERWRSDRTMDLVGAGDTTVLELYPGADPKAVADRRTGTPLLALDSWTGYAALPGNRGFLLLRSEGSDKLLAVLPTGARTVRPLGRVPAGMTPCLPDKAFVACRVQSGVEVYHYLS